MRLENSICFLPPKKTHLTIKDRYHLGVKGQKKAFWAWETRKQAAIAIQISSITYLKTKLVKRQGHTVLIKGIFYQEVITILNIYVPNTDAPSFIKHTLFCRKAIGTPTWWWWGTQYPTLTIRQAQTKYKQALELINTINQMDLTNIYRAFHRNTILSSQ